MKRANYSIVPIIFTDGSSLPIAIEAAEMLESVAVCDLRVLKPLDNAEIIKIALENAEILKLTGGVLYINGKPAAMTLASPISDNALDVLFEKSLSFAAMHGAYAAINNFFVKISSCLERCLKLTNSIPLLANSETRFVYISEESLHCSLTT